MLKAILKKLTLFSLSAACFFLLGTYVRSEAVNVLSDYVGADWKGDKLYLEKESGAIYFGRDSGKTELKAEVYFDISEQSEDAKGFIFYIDAGNSTKRGDSGYCSIQFLDGDGKLLFERSTGIIKELTNYSRFSIGNNEKFYPVPEGAKTVKILLCAEQGGSGDRVNVYFRNLNLYFSGEIPLSDTDDDPFMNSSASLSKVEIGLTPYTWWVWVGIVLMVAFAFFLIRVWRQKYATGMNK